MTMTQNVADLRIDLTVREFVPSAGDSLARYWVANGQRYSYQCTPFAVENMRNTGEDYRRHVDAGLASAISQYTEDTDPLIRDTYVMAYKHSQISEEDDEKKLLLDAMRLWMGSRMEIRKTLQRVKTTSTEFQSIRDGKIFEHDCFFLSQLYDVT